MQKGVVSIISPVYNVETFLRRTIDCIMAQTYTNWEYVLVDDGSKDSSWEIMQEYAARDNRIKILHTENHGPAVARNYAMDMATGEYVCFLDSDDYFYPTAIETMVRNIESHPDTDITGISHCQILEKVILEGTENPELTYFSPNDGATAYYNNRESMELYLEEKTIDLFVWTKMYRMSLFRDNGIDFEPIRSEEDFIINYKLFHCSRGYVHQDIALHCYTFREGSNCRSLPERDIHEFSRLNALRVDWIEEQTKRDYPELLPLAVRQKLKYNFMTICLMVAHERKECEPYFSEAMAYIRKHWRQVLSERHVWWMSRLTCWAAILLPPSIYFEWKKKRQGL